MTRRALFCLAVLGSLSAAWGQRTVTQPVAQPHILLKPLTVQQGFDQVLVSKNISASKRPELKTQFHALPEGMQDVVLSIMNEQYAAQRYMAPVKKIDPIFRLDAILVQTPMISGFYPKHGTTPNGWVIVLGASLKSSDKVLWNGAERPTHFYGPGTEFFPNSLGFQIPTDTPLATTHQVRIQRTPTVQSPPKDYRCCAERGYRGHYGWQFANFGNPTIPWHLYRDFFGAAAVEYANGTRRPAAESWYNSAYKGVGGGGNCYGMSNSSLRLRNNNMTTFHRNWFTSNPQDFCWFYPLLGQTRETVQEDQGGQLSAEMAATINNYWNNQTHKQAWQRINDLKNHLSNKPVIGFWGPNWGHATVGYDTEVSGNQYRIRMYDNNQPYQENETGTPHKSIAYVNWNDSTFHANSYATADKMVCLSYDECMRAPHLPTEAGGPGASTTGTVITVVEGGSVSQIEDENGRRFYAANGAENTNAATRIPNSMRFIPIQGGNSPYQGPAIFIFNAANNKNLTFTVAGAGPKTVSFFQPGGVLRAQFAGQGQLKFNRVLTPTHTLELLNPQTLQPSAVQGIHVAPTERVAEATNLNLGNAAATFGLSAANGGTLEVSTGAAATFDLRVETFAANQTMQAIFRGVSTQANSRATLTPADWNNLRNTTLNLNLRGLNNQLLQQRRLNQ